MLKFQRKRLLPDVPELRHRGWQASLFVVLTTLLLSLVLLTLIFPGVVERLQELRVVGELDRYAALLVVTILVYCFYVLRMHWQLDRAREMVLVEQVRVEALTYLVDQMKRLMQVAASVHVQDNLPETLQTVVDAALESLRASHVKLLLPAVVVGPGSYASGQTALSPRQWELLGPQLLDLAEPLHATNSRLGDMLAESVQDIGALTAVPLRVEIGPSGALVAEFRTPPPHPGAEVQLLRVFAENAMIAISNARLVSQIEQMAITDELTGLYNRRYLRQELGRELARANRSRHPFSVLLMDIDLFKPINDTWGHAEGDRVLRAVSAALKTATRKSAFLARYGGEEFASILPEAALAGGLRAAERMRAAVEAIEGMPRRITISIGVASFPEHGQDADELLAQADTGLYAAKHRGRNRVCTPEAQTAGAPAVAGA